MEKPAWLTIGSRLNEKGGEIFAWLLEGTELLAYVLFNCELTEIEEDE